MQHCLIVGGGLAGISAAVHLTENNFKITLIEASPKLGGRASSFYDHKFGTHLDNGQHLMLGCYTDTLELIEILDSSEDLKIQQNLSIPFVDKSGRIYNLKSGKMFSPLNILLAIFRFRLLNFSERIGLIRTMSKLIIYSGMDVSLGDWLKQARVAKREIKIFWRMLAVGIMNEEPERISTILFQKVIKTIFLTGKDSYKFIVPTKGLSEIFAEPAINFLERKGASVRLSEKLVSMTVEKGRIKELITSKNKYDAFDYVISAVPHHALIKNRLADLLKPNTVFAYSPIVTIHILLNKNPFTEPYYSLPSENFDWLFKHERYISLVKSAAWNLLSLPKEKVLDLALSEMTEYFTIFHKDLFIDYKVIKEKRATFIPDVETERKRSSISTTIENFIIAGDWTNTKLPATIEGAVRSGKIAAETVMKKIK